MGLPVHREPVRRHWPTMAMTLSYAALLGWALIVLGIWLGVAVVVMPALTLAGLSRWLLSWSLGAVLVRRSQLPWRAPGGSPR